MSKSNVSEKDDIIARMRADLVSAPTTIRLETAKEIVAGSVEVIHARLRSGERIADIHKIVNTRLESENRAQITLRTFGKYWRQARNAAGLPRIKESGPKLKTDKQSQSKPTKLKQSYTQVKNDTSSDFRTDPDDF